MIPSADGASPRVRVGRALRSLSHAVVGHDADVADLDRLADLLEAQAAALATGTVRDRSAERPSGDWGPAPADADEMFSFVEPPISGQAAPFGQVTPSPATT